MMTGDKIEVQIESSSVISDVQQEDNSLAQQQLQQSSATNERNPNPNANKSCCFCWCCCCSCSWYSFI